MRALTAPRRGRRHGPIIICGRENVVSAVRCELALETPPRVQPLTRWADQPLPSAKALFVLYLRKVCGTVVSIERPRRRSSTQARGSQLRPLVVAREALAADCLEVGTRLVWKQKSMTRGVSSHQPYQRQPGCRHQHPNHQTCHDRPKSTAPHAALHFQS